MKAPITPSEWLAINKMEGHYKPRITAHIGAKKFTLDSLVQKGLAMRDKADRLPGNPYRYWLTSKGVKIRRTLRTIL